MKAGRGSRLAILRAAFAFAALTGVAGCATAPDPESAAPGLAAAGSDVAALEPHLRPGTVLILGELHGTAEAPAFASRVVESALDRGLAVTMGLEIPSPEQPRIDAFLASAGEAADRAALLAGPFWQSSYQDGRRSAAMASLIDDLRRHAAAGRPVRVVCFDRGGRPAEREQSMAEALAAAAAEAPDDLTIVLVGNVHARLGRGGVPGVSDPMAVRLARRAPGARLVALELSYAGGAAWMCGSGVAGGCGIAAVAGRERDAAPHVTVSDTAGHDGFHGEFYVGEIHASLPAVAGRRPPPAPAPPESWAATAVESLPPAVAVAAPAAEPVPLVGEWPQWMGPRRDGGVDAGLLPLGVSARLELDWRRPIGRGFSSIAIVDRRAWTLEADPLHVRAVALDATDGRVLWRTELGAGSRPGAGRPPDPLSTPTTDGRRVFAVHPRGRLFALDAAGGAVLWSRDLVRELGASPPSYGMSTSPVLEGERLFVLVGGREGYNLTAFDPATGEVLASLGPAEQGSYATPVLGVFAGERQLVVPAGDRLYGVRLDGGGPVWSHGGVPFPDRSPLALDGGRVFLAFQEYAAMFEVSSETWEVRELWRAERLSNSYSATVHHLGALYGIGSGRLTCLDAATGRALWQRRVGMGSLVRVDDHLVVFGALSGELRLVAATPDRYSEVAVLQVFAAGQHGPTAPSFGAGRIFVRGAREIAAVRVAR